MEYNGRTKLEFALVNISHSLSLMREVMADKEVMFNHYDQLLVEMNLGNIEWNANKIVEAINGTQFLTAEDHELMYYEADKHLEYNED